MCFQGKDKQHISLNTKPHRGMSIVQIQLLGKFRAPNFPNVICCLPSHSCKCLPFIDRCFSLCTPRMKAAERTRHVCQRERWHKMNKRVSGGSLTFKLFWWQRRAGHLQSLLASYPLQPLLLQDRGAWREADLYLCGLGLE